MFNFAWLKELSANTTLHFATAQYNILPITCFQLMDKSPFTKEECEFYRERTGYEKFSSKLKKVLNENFVQSIPSDSLRQLPPRYLYPIGIILFSAMIAVFVAVFVNGYQAGIHKTYLSPLSGYTADRYCQTLPVANSGDYMATQAGIWEGQEGFDYSLAAYFASLSSFTVTYDDYKALFQLIYFSLNQIGQRMYSSDLAANLLVWMSVKLIPPGMNYANSFAFSGTPMAVFNRQKTAGILSNLFADCDATTRTTFNSATGVFTMIFLHSEYINSPKCNSIIDLALFDYIEGVDGGIYLTLSFDSRTSITGLGMGVGTSTSKFIEVADSRYEVLNYGGYNFTVAEYLDPKYSGMQPLVCATRSDDVNSWNPICMMRVSSTVYGFPLFNHIGSDLTNPISCNCSSLSVEYLDDPQSLCNRFIFLNGFLFYNSSGIEPILALVNAIGNSRSVNSKAFNAQFVASYFGQKSENRTLFQDSIYRQSLYDFCSTEEFGACSLVTFTSFDIVQNDWAVNNYYYQVKTGACRNTLVEDEVGWERLINEPFGQLTEKYQQCKNSPSAVFLSQTGVSMGNVSLVTPLFVIALILLLTCYKQCFKVTIQRSYNRVLKNRAINTLAISLLLARDSKLRRGRDNRDDVDHMKLAKMVEELAANSDLVNVYATRAKEKGGFNWRHIAGLIGKKVKAPLAAAPSSRERMEKRVDSVSKNLIAPTDRSKNYRRVAESPILRTGSASSRSSRRLSSGLSGRLTSPTAYYSVCDDALSVDPDLIILNKPAATLEIHHRPNQHRTALSVATEILEEFITKFDILLDSRWSLKHGPEFWLMSSKASQLGRLRLDLTHPKDNEVQRQFYLKLKVLTIMHGSLLLNYSVRHFYQKYANRVAYFIHGEVILLRDMNRRAGGDEMEGISFTYLDEPGEEAGIGSDVAMNTLGSNLNVDERDSDDDTDGFIEEMKKTKEIDVEGFQQSEESDDDDSGYELTYNLLELCRIKWEIAALESELED